MAAINPILSSDIFEHDNVPGLPAVPDTDAGEIDEIQALQSVISQLGSSDNEAKVYVYRKTDGKRDNVFLGTYDPRDFTLDTIQQEFGGGDFRIRLYDSNRRLRKNQLVCIEAPKKPDAATDRRAGEYDATISASLDKFAQTVGQALSSLAAQQANMIAAMNSRPAQESRGDFLKEMLTMKQIFAAENQPQQNPFEIFKAGIEFAREVAPREGEIGAGELILEGMKTFGKPLADIMQSASKNATPGNVSTAITGPEVIPAPAPAPVPVSVPESDPNVIARFYMSMLLQQAKNDTDPQTYASVILDYIPDDQARDFLSKPDWFDIAVNQVPEAAPFRPWFEKLRDEIMMLTEPDNDAINDNDACKP